MARGENLHESSPVRQGGNLPYRILAATLFVGVIALFWPSVGPLDAAPSVRTEAAPNEAASVSPITQKRPILMPLAVEPEQETIRLTAALRQGDSLGGMLRRAGIGGADAERAAALIAAEVPVDGIAPGTPVEMTLGARASATTPRPLERLSFRPRLDLSLALERRGGELALVRQPIAVAETRLRVRGIAGTSLYRSARAAGVPASTAQQYLRALDRHLALDRDVLPSDEFDMVIVQRRAADGESEAGELLYAGLDRKGQPQAQLLRWGKKGRFHDAAGGEERSASPTAPVAGRITSGFGPRRHPILGYTRMHSGIDIRAPYGTPIHAASDGVVVFAGSNGGHGNFVRLAHSGGVGTGYAHMSRIAVRPGMRVLQGEVIGYVGSSGLSTGPHLHYEFYRDGRPVDPSMFRFVDRSPLEAGEAAAFRARLAELRRLKPGPYRAQR